MFALLTSFLELRNLVSILVGLSAFATILTLAGSLLQGDRLAARMKQVASERERLRAKARAASAASEGRLRERSRGPLAEIVELLNLRRLSRPRPRASACARRGFAASAISSPIWPSA